MPQTKQRQRDQRPAAGRRKGLYITFKQSCLGNHAGTSAHYSRSKVFFRVPSKRFPRFWLRVGCPILELTVTKRRETWT